MITFIFTISFILHIIAIFAIYHLFKQIQQLKQKNTNDMEELFESYLQEIKDENRRLEAELETTPTFEQRHNTASASDTLEKDLSNGETEIDETYVLPESEAKDSVEASLQAKILQLHHQGLSITEIAQKLNCGKAEATMIIKLHT